MKNQGFHIFDTAVGSCGIAWGERGIVGIQLPEATAAATRRRVRERFPSAAEATPTRDVAGAIKAITALLAGKGADLSTIGLDMDGLPPFHSRVYEAVRTIAPGVTKSYGEVATGLGSPNSSRAVGQAMRRNPFPIVVPCHRVLAAGGTGGFTAPGGVDTKKRMLAIEGVDLDAARPKKPRGAASIAAKGKETSKVTKAVTAKSKPAAKTVAKPVAKPAPRAGIPADAIFDYRKAVRALRASDAVMAKLIDRVGPLRLGIKQTGSIFGALSEAIVYQQLNGKAAATIHGRVCDLFPRTKGGFTHDDILGANDADLRGAGLSRAKTAAIKDLAQKTVDSEIPTLAEIRRMPDDEIVASLTKVRGIGRWTVEMLLMFRLGRADVLPVDDFGVRKGFSIAYGLADMPTPKELARHGEKWAPWRSAAAWYLWRATELPKP